MLHPGRAFAVKLAAGLMTVAALTVRLAEYFAGHSVPLIPTDEAVDAGAADDDDE